MINNQSAFLGCWRIMEMELWDQDYVDMEAPGHITFDENGLGQLHFGLVNVGLDWRYYALLDRVDFSFEGFDESDPVSGRGWARVDRKQLFGLVVFHLGDESAFMAKKSR